MSCSCEATPPVAGQPTEEHTPWYREPDVLIPIASGLLLVLGIILELLAPQPVGTPGQSPTGAGLSADWWAQVSFWGALLLGASTFVPGALKALFSRGKLGIALLMTISAAGAVVLGYVEEAAALAFLYSIAEALEDQAMKKARRGLRGLLKLIPEIARIDDDGQLREVVSEQLIPGDVLLIRPGERVATDAVVIDGQSALDTSVVTGESIPVTVGAGDDLHAGTINTTGVLRARVTAAGTDNSLTQLVHLVEQAQQSKGQRARIADRLAKPLVPGVIILAILVGVVGSILGDPEVWITRALVVLVAASPCAMAISVPVTVISGIGAASKLGVIIKSGAAFEELGTLKRMAFDKTGTLTLNQPKVVEIHTTAEMSSRQALDVAASLEAHSTHPLAQAIVDATTPAGQTTHQTAPSGAQNIGTQDLVTPESDRSSPVHRSLNITEEPGLGVTGTVNGRQYRLGNPQWLMRPEATQADTPHVDPELTAQLHRMESAGQTCVILSQNKTPVAVIGIRDDLRPEAPETVTVLHEHGITTAMLTGDNHRTAQALADQAGITEHFAALSPEAKAEKISAWAHQTPTGMIGDGVNDAPALAAATVGIAMGATGSDAAVESADVAFTGNDLRMIPRALAHARRGRGIINQNIVLSAAIIVGLVPLAITGVLGLAAVVLIHEIAEVIVILNGLRASKVADH